MATGQVNDPGGGGGDVGSSDALVLSLAAQGVPVAQIAAQTGYSEATVAQILQGGGYTVTPAPTTPFPGSPTTYVYTAPQQGTAGQPQNLDTSGQPSAPGKGKGTDPLTNPNAKKGGNTGNTYITYGSSGGPNYAADLAEKKREFDVTTSRDIAKENAAEVDALQKELAALSGPKDAYADYFFAHGLMPPRGYKPAPVPLTDAQIAAYGKMGVSPQQLQTMISGNGQPGADYGMLGNMGSALQTPSTMPQPTQGPPTSQVQAQSPNNPTVQGGALYGQTPQNTVSTQQNVINANTPKVPTTPGGVPSMAVGGQVPGAPGTPTLAVLHGGEQVTPAPQGMSPGQDVTSSQAPTPPGMMNNPGLHPAIAALVDAVSGLLSNPDFKPFVAAAAQSPVATPGGVQSMATGGIVGQTPLGQSNVNLPMTPSEDTSRGGITQTAPPSTPSTTPPTQSTAPAAQSRVPATQTSVIGGQPGPATQPPAATPGMVASTNTNALPTNPIMPIANMDPYTRALYDINGRLHPYSAQQEAQMGPLGLSAVSSYVGTVEGGNVDAYKNLVDRLRPQGAPVMGDVGAEGFTSA